MNENIINIIISTIAIILSESMVSLCVNSTQVNMSPMINWIIAKILLYNLFFCLSNLCFFINLYATNINNACKVFILTFMILSIKEVFKAKQKRIELIKAVIIPNILKYFTVNATIKILKKNA